MSRLNSKGLSDRVLVLFLLFVCLSIFYPSIFGEVNTVDDADMMQHVLTFDSIDLKRLFFYERAYYYRPVLYLTYVIDMKLWGREQSFWHLENIIIHALNGILVFLITKRLLLLFAVQTYRFVPFFVSLLFVLHPLNTESVNWISGRTDLLSAFFVFLSFYTFLLHLDGRRGCLVFSGLFYLLGLLSKESAIGLPVVIAGLFLVRTGSNRRLRHLLLYGLYFLSITGVYFLLRFSGSEYSGSAFGRITSGEGGSDFIEMALIFLKALGFYIKKLFVPLPLNFAIVEVNTPAYVLTGTLMFLLLVYLMIKKRGLFTYLFFSAVAFFSTSIPVAMFKMAWTPFAERYLYVSTFAVALIVVVALFHLNIPFRAKEAMVVLLVFLSGIITAQRNLVWQSNLALYEDTVKKSPGVAAVRNEYGIALSRAGRIEEALKQFAIAAELGGRQYLLPVLNMIEETKIKNEGNVKEARRAYERLLRDYSDSRSRYVILKRIVEFLHYEATTEKNPEEAKRLYRLELGYLQELISIQKTAWAMYRLGQLYLAFNDRDRAIEAFRTVAEEFPDDFYSKYASELVANISGKE